MSEHPFQSFIDLITFDQEIIGLQNEIRTLEQDIKSVREEARESTQTEQDLKQKSHDARKNVDELELELKEIEQQLKDKKVRLDSITSQREYDSIQAEIKGLDEKQLANEEVLVEAWNNLENAEKKYASKEAEFGDQIEELEKKEEESLASIESLKKDIEQRNAQRPEKTKSVPEEWLEKYAMMRERVSDPVVPELNGACSACFYDISSQDMLLLKRKKLLQCKGCYRFLFIQDVLGESTQEEQTKEPAE